MKPKLEKNIRKVAYPIILRASLGQIPEKKLGEMLDKYIKFLDIAFKIITGVTISVTFLWFIPVYLGYGYDRVMVILLLVVMAILKFGTIKVKVE